MESVLVTSFSNKTGVYDCYMMFSIDIKHYILYKNSRLHHNIL